MVRFYLYLYISPYVPHLVSLNNLIFPKANHLKFIHKIRNHKRKVKFKLQTVPLFPFLCFAPDYFSCKRGVFVSYSHILPFFNQMDNAAVK